MLNKLANTYKNYPSCSYNSGDIIYNSNTPADRVYLIERGIIKVYHSSSEGNIMLQYCSSGEIPGLKDIFRNKNYTNTAEAVTDCFLYIIPFNEFRKMLRENPELRVDVMKSLCGRIENLEHKISCLKENTAAKRFEEVLNILVMEFGTSPKGDIKLRLSVEDIAALTCMSKSYTKKVISEFTNKGIISYSAGKLKILDKKTIEKKNAKY